MKSAPTSRMTRGNLGLLRRSGRRFDLRLASGRLRPAAGSAGGAPVCGLDGRGFDLHGAATGASGCRRSHSAASDFGRALRPGSRLGAASAATAVTSSSAAAPCGRSRAGRPCSSSSSGSSISRRSKIAFALPGMSMRIASSVISMILPNTMSPPLTGGRSRGGPCFFSRFFFSRGLGAACSSADLARWAPRRLASSPLLPSGRASAPACRRPHPRRSAPSSCGDGGDASSSRRCAPGGPALARSFATLRARLGGFASLVVLVLVPLCSSARASPRRRESPRRRATRAAAWASPSARTRTASGAGVGSAPAFGVIGRSGSSWRSVVVRKRRGGARERSAIRADFPSRPQPPLAERAMRSGRPARGPRDGSGSRRSAACRRGAASRPAARAPA